MPIKKLRVKSQPWKDAVVICNHSVDEYCRNSATSHWMLQKSCNRSVTRCRRKFCDYSVTCGNNSTITQFHVVAEILQSLMIGCRRDWVITEFLRNSAITQSQVVAEILRPLSHWLSLKLRIHLATRCRRNSGNTLQVVNTAI